MICPSFPHLSHCKVLFAGFCHTFTLQWHIGTKEHSDIFLLTYIRLMSTSIGTCMRHTCIAVLVPISSLKQLTFAFIAQNKQV